MTPHPNHADASSRIAPEKAAVRPPAARTPVAGPGVAAGPGTALQHATTADAATSLERLLAEEIPDGTFGGARDPRPAAQPTRREPDPQAGEHVADLLAAIQPARRRHLRAVPDNQTRKAAA